MQPPNVVPDAVIDSIARSHVLFIRQGEDCPRHDRRWQGLNVHDAPETCPCTCRVDMRRFERIMRELRWSGDHYSFDFAGMYVGVELDGYMHT